MTTADHDHRIFAPIETAEIDLKSAEHRFLLAYRATFYEIHAKVAVAMQLQQFSQNRRALGIDPKNGLTSTGLLAANRWGMAYETQQFKTLFDVAYLNQEYEAIQHNLVTLNVQQPTLAACALFWIAVNASGDDVVRVCLTILPIDQHRTICLFSYLQNDAGCARAELDRVLSSSGDHQKYEISRRLLNHCENFVLSPRFVRSWAPEKRRTILDLFSRTVFETELDFEHPDLQLFA